MMDYLTHVLILLFLAVMPISEVRGALPYGVLIAGFHPVLAFILSVGGNIAIIYPLLYLLGWVEKFLFKTSKKNFSSKIRVKIAFLYVSFTSKIRKKVNPYVDRYGVVGLVLYTLIPLPFTGAWTASVAAHLLGMKRNTAFMAVALGVIFAGLIMLAMIFLGFSIKPFL